jgi:hypothetical protein
MRRETTSQITATATARQARTLRPIGGLPATIKGMSEQPPVSVKDESTVTDRHRRWGRRSLWLLPALLALYVTVMVVDLVWYRSHVPIRFRDANWEGRWETRRYWGLSGRLLVRLPDPIPEGVDFKVEALVYYPLYSVWRTGQFVRMDFKGQFQSRSATSGGRTTNDIPFEGGLLKLKGVVGNQVVEYAALLNDGRSQIVGGYLSQNPDDYGWFSIKRY